MKSVLLSTGSVLLALVLVSGCLCRAYGPVRPEHFTGIWVKMNAAGETIEEISFQDGVKHGSHTKWFAPEHKKWEYRYDLGRLHGRQMEWFPDGRQRKEFYCRYDDMHGRYVVWDESGAVASDGVYNDGRPWSGTFGDGTVFNEGVMMQNPPGH
jgi:hypothetical protein